MAGSIRRSAAFDGSKTAHRAVATAATVYLTARSREQHLARTKTMDETQPKGKILRGIEGVGTLMPEMIDQRVRQIARCDGRAEANDLDRTRASEDLSGGSEQSRTVGEPDPDWYTPLGSSNEKAPTVRPEDEENIPKKLSSDEGRSE